MGGRTSDRDFRAGLVGLVSLEGREGWSEEGSLESLLCSEEVLAWLPKENIEEMRRAISAGSVRRWEGCSREVAVMHVWDGGGGAEVQVGSAAVEGPRCFRSDPPDETC